MSHVTIIRLDEPCIECVICGQGDVSRWGLAVYEGRIVPDDYQGEWGGAPCCEKCYQAWKDGAIEPWMSFGEARQAILIPSGPFLQI